MIEVRAAVLRDYTDPYSIEDLRLEPPAADQVLVRIQAAGMCHTDVLPRSPEWPSELPLVTGHEGAGVVTTVGTGVTDVAEGDHVVISFASCGHCLRCASGHPGYCDDFVPANLLGLRHGVPRTMTDSQGRKVNCGWFGQSSFASHVIADSRNVVVVNKSIPFEVCAPLGCGLLTGAGAVLRALPVKAGESIAVFGVGAVGLASVMAAKVAGAGRIVAIDRNESRLELAQDLGATDVALSTEPEQMQRTLAPNPAGELDYTLDTTGNPEVLKTAVNWLRPGGTCGLIGVLTGPLVLDPAALGSKSITGIVEGDAIPRELIPVLLGLYQRGLFPIDRLIKRYELAQIDEAERATLVGEVVKPVIVMN